MKHWLTIHTHLHSWIVHVVSILYIGHHLGCWCYSWKLFISMPSDILKCFPQVCPQTQTIRKQSVTILAFLSQWSLKSQGWPSPFFWNHHKESVFFINLFAGSSPKKKKMKKRELHDSSSSKFPVAPFWFATLHSALRMVVKVLGSNLRDCHGANMHRMHRKCITDSHASHEPPASAG